VEQLHGLVVPRPVVCQDAKCHPALSNAGMPVCTQPARHDELTM
jgi:hypothetical protein